MPVNLSVFDVRGRHIVTLVDGTLPAGTFEAIWRGRDDRGRRMAPGMYFYRMKAGPAVRTMKMLLLR